MDSKDKAKASITIAIDGPAGAGKTTVSKRLAQELGYRYIDTGALYRAVAVAAVRAGIEPDDDAALADLCRGITVDLQERENGLQVLLNGEEITDSIRAPEISMMASAVSARPIVREFLLAAQRELGAKGSVVAEGRDMGTVVFPRAEAKFFLVADSGVRAKRRHDELKVKSGKKAPSLDAVHKDMNQRDHNDSSRAVAPLQPADDAIVIDSTCLTLEQVVARMLDHISQLI